MSTILLYGNLADKYGKEFKASVYSVADAISCMAANFPNFRHDIIKNENYNVFVDDRDIGEDELEISVKDKTIKIVPIVGGGSGGTKMVIGFALAALTFVPTGGASASIAMGMGLSSGISGAIFNIGVGMLFSGFAELLFSPPEGDVDDKNSYMFSGAENNIKQGVPVQVGYGRLLIGSTTISTELNNISVFSERNDSMYNV